MFGILTTTWVQLRLPKILRMSSKLSENSEANLASPLSLNPVPLAEIVTFPNAPGNRPDRATKMRWLKLADEILDERKTRKKA
jgi:hypothetical protein